MTRNGSETDCRMALNSSDSLGMNFNRILSPGWVNLPDVSKKKVQNGIL